MKDLNNVTFTGRLGGDPELKHTPSGASVASMTVAVNGGYKTKTGEWKEETSWIRCSAFGITAEMISEQLKKGSPVIVNGSLKTSEWTTKEGQKRRDTFVDVYSFRALAPSVKQEGGPKPVPKPQQPQADTINDDDFPPF